MPVDHPQAPSVPVRTYSPLIALTVSFVLVLGVLLLAGQALDLGVTPAATYNSQ